jgi:hypothetical protein
VSEDEQYKKFSNPSADIPKLSGVFGGKKTVSAGNASGALFFYFFLFQFGPK